MKKVRYTYFKETGKLYSTEDVEFKQYADWDSVLFATRMCIKDKSLPGLTQDHSDFHVLVEALEWPEDCANYPVPRLFPIGTQ